MYSVVGTYNFRLLQLLKSLLFVVSGLNNLISSLNQSLLSLYSFAMSAAISLSTDSGSKMASISLVLSRELKTHIAYPYSIYLVISLYFISICISSTHPHKHTSTLG